MWLRYRANNNKTFHFIIPLKHESTTRSPNVSMKLEQFNIFKACLALRCHAYIETNEHL